jgi:hypothetical protein
MRVKCLGRAILPHETTVITNIPRPDYGDSKAKDNKQGISFWDDRITLGSKQYYVVSDNDLTKSKESWEKFTKTKNNEPMQIVESISGQTNLSTQGRLWLYDDIVFKLDRNNYELDQVKLLIRSWLENEDIFFKKLEEKK